MNSFRTGLAKILIGFFGWIVVLLGVILLPLPGPGWLIIFIGLSILSTQYKWARKLRHYVHVRYEGWHIWFAQQPLIIKSLFWITTLLTIVILLWLSNVYSLIDTLLSLDKDWLSSPFIR